MNNTPNSHTSSRRTFLKRLGALSLVGISTGISAQPLPEAIQTRIKIQGQDQGGKETQELIDYCSSKNIDFKTLKRILLKDFQLRIEIDEKYLEESRIKYAKAPAGLDEPREAVKSAEESLEWHKYQLQILESCTSFEALKEVCSSKLKIIYFKEVKEEIDRYLLLKRIDKVTERVGGILGN